MSPLVALLRVRGIGFITQTTTIKRVLDHLRRPELPPQAAARSQS